MEEKGVLVVDRPRLVEFPPEIEAMFATARSLGGWPLVVGGSVRDPLLGRESKDLDVEVHGPLDFERLGYALAESHEARQYGWRVRFVGISFYVLKVWTRSGYEVDISVPRRERQSGPGHRGFETVQDGSMGFREASARRDFTVNALGWDPATGKLYDAWGGLHDLEARILRHTTDRFAEDPLRPLRAVRFAGQFGFTLAPETVALCGSMWHRYAELPIERVWGEMYALARKGVHISNALQALAETGWEQHFRALADLHHVPQDPAYHQERDVWVHTGWTADVAAALADDAGLTGEDRAVGVFAALCHDMGKPRTTLQRPGGKITSYNHEEEGVPVAAVFLAEIGAPASVIRRVLPLVREHMVAYHQQGPPTASAVRRLARRLSERGGVTVAEWARLVQADQLGRLPAHVGADAFAWAELAAELDVVAAPLRPMVNGDMLIAAGMRPGPVFKPVLQAALAAQDEGTITDAASAKRWLADYLGDQPSFLGTE